MDPFQDGVAFKHWDALDRKLSTSIFAERVHWKINIEPENDVLEDDLPFQLGDF